MKAFCWRMFHPLAPGSRGERDNGCHFYFEPGYVHVRRLQTRPCQTGSRTTKEYVDAPPVEEFTFPQGEYLNCGHSLIRQTTLLSWVGEWVSKLTCNVPGAISKRVRPTPETLSRNVMSARHGGLRQLQNGARWADHRCAQPIRYK